MKRWVHASIDESARKIARAKRELAEYDPEKVDFVKRCQDDISREISRYYAEEDEYDQDESVIGVSLSAIKTDWMMEAIEEDLMTEEEFEEIFDLIDIVGLELAAAYS